MGTATVMITMYFIYPWADRQLQFERHSAGPADGKTGMEVEIII